VSRGRGPVCADIALWNRIWRHQLGLTSEDEFWEVLKSGVPPTRGGPRQLVAEPQMPAWLFEGLVHTYGVEEDEVRSMSEADALARYLALCERGGPGRP